MEPRRVGRGAGRRRGVPRSSGSRVRCVVCRRVLRLKNCGLVPNPHRIDVYTELHTSSAFSFLDGASLPEVLIDRAAALGYPALALLDRDGVYGAPRFHLAAKRAGIKAIIGAELTVSSGSPSPFAAPAARRSTTPAAEPLFGSAPPRSGLADSR